MDYKKEGLHDPSEEGGDLRVALDLLPGWGPGWIGGGHRPVAVLLDQKGVDSSHELYCERKGADTDAQRVSIH